MGNLAEEVRALFKRQTDLTMKIVDLYSKYYTLIDLMEKVDGNANSLPEPIIIFQRQIEELLNANLRLIRFDINELSIRKAEMDLSSNEISYTLLLKYGPLLDELIELYRKKMELKERENNSEVGGKLPTDPSPNYIGGINDKKEELNEMLDINAVPDSFSDNNKVY